MRRFPAFLLIASVLSGCAAAPSRPQPEPLMSAAWPADAHATAVALLVADNQEHESAGGNDLSKSGPVRDRSPSYRSPEQMLYGRSILERVLRMHRDLPVVFLGDVLDVSCASEFERFAETLRRLDRPWVIAPGNHDGFFMGVSLPSQWRRQVGLGLRAWDTRCTRQRDLVGKKTAEQHAMAFTKQHYIDAYLRLLAADRGVVPADWAGNPGVPASMRACLLEKLGKGKSGRCTLAADQHSGEAGQLLDIRWRGAHPAPGPLCPKQCGFPDRAPQAMLLQLVYLGTTTDGQHLKLLLLDTANYPSAPTDLLTMTRKLRSNPGTTAGIEEAQWKEITRVVNALAPGDRLLLAGHHPLADWQLERKGNPLRGRLTTLAQTIGERTGQPVIYLSAHTHTGYAVHHRDPDIIEINIGSLIDWPISYRTLELLEDGASAPHLMLPLHELRVDGGSAQEPPRTVSLHRLGPKRRADAPNQQQVIDKQDCAGTGSERKRLNERRHRQIAPWALQELIPGVRNGKAIDLMKDQIDVLRDTTLLLAGSDGRVALPRWKLEEPDNSRCVMDDTVKAAGGTWYRCEKTALLACFDALTTLPKTSASSTHCYAENITDDEGVGNHHKNMAGYVDQYLYLTGQHLGAATPSAIEQHMYCNAVWGSIADCGLGSAASVRPEHCRIPASKMPFRTADHPRGPSSEPTIIPLVQPASALPD